MNGSQLKKVKNKLRDLFLKFGLNLINKCNNTTVGSLDIPLNLLDGTYKPYQEPEIH